MTDTAPAPLTVVLAAQRNRYLRAALDRLEGFDEAISVAEQARQMRAELVDPKPCPSPVLSGKVTWEWVNSALVRRREAEDVVAQRAILLELEHNAQRGAESLYLTGTDDILAHLQGELTKLLRQVADLVPDLRGATNAAEAVEIDAGPAWRQLTELAPNFNTLWGAHLLAMGSWPDYVQAARPSHGAAEPLASDLRLRNLDAIWPGWRQAPAETWTIAGAPPRLEPWPEDAAAQLLWLVTSDAEPWIPTIRELDQLVAERGERRSRGGRTYAEPLNIQQPVPTR